jgi:DNA helicase-2/ATP-dependent DNA helicase PcrA
MSKHLEGLNEAQRQAVDHQGSPLLIVAGAGTGKTTVLTRRYARLLERGLTTDHILALTFTEKAAGEMEDRVLQLLPNGAYDFWISTFHGFCQRLLEKYGLEIGLPNQFRLVTETDAWLLLKRRIAELPLDHYRPLGNPVKFLGALLSHISRAKDEGVTPEMYLEFAENARLDGDEEFVTGERRRLQELAACYAKYRMILREEGALDFGDLIVETLRLLKERPHVLSEIRAQFKEVMVDEFQDTNWAQYELVKLIAGERRCITVVGDDDQAIYKFRGASLANILQFRDDYPEAKTVLLTENYRSRQEILDAAYGFIRKNDPNRLEVRLADQGFSKRLTAASGGGGTVEVQWFRSLEDEADAVAARIGAIKQADPELHWSDFAVLSRSNDGAEPFAFALERSGIPYRFTASAGLYATPVVVDICAFMSAAVGRWDGPTMWRILNAPCYDVPPADIAVLIQQADQKAWGMWHALRNVRTIAGLSEASIARLEQIRGQLEKLTETARRERPLMVFQAAVEQTGYLQEILRRPEADKLEAVRLLNAFASRVKRYESGASAPTAKEFLDDLRLEIDSGEEGSLPADAEEGPDTVKVMTVHASKGLEFKYVFIASMVDQRFPTRARGEAIPLPDGLVNERLPDGDAHVEEERRLFYVALTRAKLGVVLTGAEDYGGARKKKPSVFLGEADLDIPAIVKGEGPIASLRQPTKREIEEKAVFALKRRFSFTQLAAFEKCPMQYKFAHVYKLPVLGKFQKSFGQAIHQTFQSILQKHEERGAARQSDLFTAPVAPPVPANGFRVTLDEALEIYDERWALNDDWYPDRRTYDEYKSKGRDAVKSLMEDWAEAPPEVGFLEAPFEWRLGEERSIRGSVDRIDRLPNGHYRIYDYKTGSAKTDETIDATAKQQLWIYQLAMEEKGLPIDQLTYLYVLDGSCLDVPILQGEEREAFRAKLMERMEGILTSHFPPMPSVFNCRSCDFRAVCEYRKM